MRCLLKRSVSLPAQGVKSKKGTTKTIPNNLTDAGTFILSQGGDQEKGGQPAEEIVVEGTQKLGGIEPGKTGLGWVGTCHGSVPYVLG